MPRGSIIGGVTPPVTPISVEYNLTPPERKEGRAVLIRPGAATRKRRTVPGLIGWVFFIGLAVLFFMLLRSREGRVAGPRVERPVETARPAARAPDDAREHRLRLIAVTVCISSAAVFVAVIWTSIIVVRREQRRKDSGAGRQRMTYTFTEDAMIETAGAKTTHLYWPAFHSFAETEQLFVIRNSPDEGPVIPKRLFTSEAEVGQVRELLVRKLTPPPLPQNPPTPPTPPWLTSLEGS